MAEIVGLFGMYTAQTIWVPEQRYLPIDWDPSGRHSARLAKSSRWDVLHHKGQRFCLLI